MVGADLGRHPGYGIPTPIQAALLDWWRGDFRSMILGGAIPGSLVPAIVEGNLKLQQGGGGRLTTALSFSDLSSENVDSLVSRGHRFEQPLDHNYAFESSLPRQPYVSDENQSCLYTNPKNAERQSSESHYSTPTHSEPEAPEPITTSKVECALV